MRFIQRYANITLKWEGIIIFVEEMISETNVCLDDISQVNGALVDLLIILPMTQLFKQGQFNK